MADNAEAQEQGPKTVWPCLVYKDAPAAIQFLVDAFGFEERIVVKEDDDPSVIHHAELRWPEGGGVMLGSAGRGNVLDEMPAGVGATYVVTDRPDEVHDQAVAAGARVVQELKDEDYGSRGFSAADPEGVIWSFGTYRGE
jgi:uncharacterized glyoxalase superfamily protein PhnB